MSRIVDPIDLPFLNSVTLIARIAVSIPEGVIEIVPFSGLKSIGVSVLINCSAVKPFAKFTFVISLFFGAINE